MEDPMERIGRGRSPQSVVFGRMVQILPPPEAALATAVRLADMAVLYGERVSSQRRELSLGANGVRSSLLAALLRVEEGLRAWDANEESVLCELWSAEQLVRMLISLDLEGKKTRGRKAACPNGRVSDEFFALLEACEGECSCDEECLCGREIAKCSPPRSRELYRFLRSVLAEAEDDDGNGELVEDGSDSWEPPAPLTHCVKDWGALAEHLGLEEPQAVVVVGGNCFRSRKAPQCARRLNDEEVLDLSGLGAFCSDRDLALVCATA